ncbi:MAG TPA: type II secretion system F family protein [Vicinamibacterales bacterium]|jgi:type IV pilus assembly protein PilC|nr:type II secretion system F family protein [Vicinamibacterales bacterium]
MEYRCRLGTPGGEIIEGIYVADNEARLRREFEEKGLLVLAIQQGGRRALAGLRLPALPKRHKVPSREFLVFNQELATLLKAGMPLVQSLDILRRRITNPIFKSVLDDVFDRVRAGSALSEAFEAHGTLFPGVYTASLLAGEKSGNLEQVLRRYVSYVKIVSSVRRKTVSALVYPAILLALSLIVVTIIVVKVVPEFGSFYNQFGKELPLSTRVIVAVSDFVTTYFLLIAGGLVAAALAAWYWLKQPGQKKRLDRQILKVPALGPIAQKFSTSQGARTLATLLGGGIPLVNALEVTSRSLSNEHMAGELTSAAQQVREGRALAMAMQDSGAFPDVAIKMVEVGESTGALQEMLNSLADFYDEEIDTNLGRFVTVIEPILLVVMGLVIAGLLLSLYLPLFNLSSALQR